MKKCKINLIFILFTLLVDQFTKVYNVQNVVED